WAHDLQTKKPLANAMVRAIKITNEKEQTFDVIDLGNTGTDGVAHFTLEKEAIALEVFSGQRAVLVKFDSMNAYGGYGWGGWWNPGGVSVDEDHWGYAYTDRSVYAQKDRVHIWGLLKSRNGDQIPQKGTLTLTSSVYGYSVPGEWSNAEYASVPIEMNANGTFVGEIPLPAVGAGSYQIVANFGGKTIGRSIDVQEYRKPVYFLELSLNRKAAIVGDTVKFTTTAKYFDGTPVVGKTVHVGPDCGETKDFVLLSDGTASGEFVVRQTNYGCYVRAELSEPGFETASTGQSLQVFPSSIDIQAEGKIANNMVTVQLKTNRVEITSSDDFSDYTKNARPKTEVTATATQTWYEQIPEGESYDFIRKSVQKNYRYEQHVDTVYTGTVTTDEQGKAVIQFPVLRKDAYYYVDLKAKDDQGRIAEQGVYPYYGDDAVWYESPKSNGGSADLQFFNPQTDVPNGKQTYRIGDTVRLEVEQFGKRFEMREGDQFLFFQAQRGVQEYEVSSKPEYKFLFEDRDAPNIFAYAVLFTGSQYITVDSYGNWTSGKQIYFDTESRKLDVRVTMDKTNFRPGTDAQVNVNVSDASGRPVAVDLNLSVVDEAFFAMFPDNPDPLSSLYRALPSGINAVLVTHRPEVGMGGGAEGGGGGDGPVRSNFVDTAAFVTAKTGNDGHASVNIKLPDNVTSWRVTTHAIDANQIQAGVTKKNFNTTLPFFINTSVQSTYLIEDRPSIVVTAAGIGVKQTDKIAYELSVENTSYGFSAEATIGSRAHLPLPQLPEGTHKVIIKAKSGEYQDAVSYPIQIVSSRLTIPAVKQEPLTNQTTLSGAENGLTYVTFMDGNQGKMYQSLLNFAWRYGDRADEAVVRTVSTELMNETFHEDRLVPETDVTTYQSEGGIRLLPYASVDPVLSAKVALLKETPFDEEHLYGYLMSRLYSADKSQQLSSDEAAWAFAGLAALDAPVLAEMKRFGSDQTLSDEAKLALAIGYVAAGDAESARPIYQTYLKAAKHDLAYIWSEQKTAEDTTEITSQLAILAAGLNEAKDRDALQSYLNAHADGQTLTLLEQLITTKSALPFLKPGASSVSYTLSGETKKIELKQGNTATVAVSPEDLKKLRPHVEKGDVAVVTSYEKPLTTLPNLYNKISLKRRYVGPNGQTQTSFKEGDVVRVELSYQIDKGLPNEYFQITDALPSGLTSMTWRDIGGYHEGNYCMSYPEADTDQSLTFFVYDESSNKYCPPNTVTYYARVLNTGTFKAEKASIRASRAPSLINFSNEATISINE
ncbi:MAG: alpha-2-macroglobulin family protein, partial [Patescibacteria group bacterium]